MSDPIRVLHFADTHIGMENYGKTDPETGLSSRLRDFLRRMDEMIEHTRTHGVDLVIFAGDAFKTRTPSPTYQREFAHRIIELAGLAPVVMLVGNHDVPPNYLRASSIEIYDTLRVPNVYVANDYQMLKIATARGDVIVGCAPYPMKSYLMAETPTAGMGVGEVDQLLVDAISMRLEGLAAEADTYGDLPRLLTGHFTVSGAVVGSEREIMLGRDISLSLSLIADPRWDYVALGHIHKHQNLTAARSDAPPVVYSGSLERIDFGEEGDPKGFCRVDLTRTGTQWEFIPLQARPFVTVKADLRNDDKPTQTLQAKLRRHDLKEAVVRVIVELSPENEEQFNEASVRGALVNHGAFFVAGISKQVERPTRIRLGESPEELSPMELLDRYLQSNQLVSDFREKLLAAAEGIFNYHDDETL
jgi:exonuclease SbcD